MSVAQTEPTIRDNIEAELETIRASIGCVIIVRPTADADQVAAPPQYSAIITGFRDHQTMPWIKFGPPSEEEVFEFHKDTVKFRWIDPRALEVTNADGFTIIIYTQA